ncbi:20S-pre-rRNA D-site endonuclease nob1 [Purpureocillium takamizusanense]|uniref:20S-pre-rRNA D-site endonuclease NOB1 n=1 Tax=Purpureocillium takamizusanense TaxID=2060973 RepID=A0A9Q8QGN4_9HYPO|nr:20S-pre-rRNA D-site endonuclease nob1 [Purpureocillium takamizusanense]UNI19538.1 20S-pre-rRNA D-site endonuclease nob1 [Purpureocillium takamizusanense]
MATPTEAGPAPPQPVPEQQQQKPIHSLVLDTGPLIKNDPPVSTLLARAERLYTLPVILSEIRDAVTLARVETTLLPFLMVRAPRPESVRHIRDFARRTGDLAVLSRPDVDVLALGYELECERNGGDWRLRNTPGQKGLNGRPGDKESRDEQPTTSDAEAAVQDPVEDAAGASQGEEAAPLEQQVEEKLEKLDLNEASVGQEPLVESSDADNVQAPEASGEKQDEVVSAQQDAEEEGSDSDSDGWITPSNVKKHKDHDANAAAHPSGGSSSSSTPLVLQAAVLTSDYAMQNVALRMNLNLVAPSLARITRLKSWVLRCHGCFAVTKDMEKQFCPSCGQPTLMRASCSTDERGNFRVHLKKNFQWNNRGNVYSVPKPVHGSANGRHRDGGGGKNGWGSDLVLAEDQKEYTRAQDEQRRERRLDVMDQDYLPGILTGSRSGGRGGKLRVGAGRNVNSKRKH